MGIGSSQPAEAPRAKEKKPKLTYSHSAVELLVSQRKLAPRRPVEDPEAPGTGTKSVRGTAKVEPVECPICFLNYNEINRVDCCQQNICTDCYVTVRNTMPDPEKCICPFCNKTGFKITYIAAPRFDYHHDEHFDNKFLAQHHKQTEGISAKYTRYSIGNGTGSSSASSSSFMSPASIKSALGLSPARTVNNVDKAANTNNATNPRPIGGGIGQAVGMGTGTSGLQDTGLPSSPLQWQSPFHENQNDNGSPSSNSIAGAGKETPSTPTTKASPSAQVHYSSQKDRQQLEQQIQTQHLTGQKPRSRTLSEGE